MSVSCLQSALCNAGLEEIPGPYASRIVPAPRTVCSSRCFALEVDLQTSDSRIPRLGSVVGRQLGSSKIPVLAQALRRHFHRGFLTDSRPVRSPTRRVDGARLSR